MYKHVSTFVMAKYVEKCIKIASDDCIMSKLFSTVETMACFFLNLVLDWNKMFVLYSISKRVN